MATPTYTPIETYTLGSSQSSITFSSLSGYTDLILVSSPIITGGTAYNLQGWFNSDNAGTSYSFTRLTSNGSSIGSDSIPNYPVMVFSANVKPSTTYGSQFIIQIPNYANTSMYKTALSRGGNVATGTDTIINTWRSTAAITSFTIRPEVNSFAAGSTFTLYGIANAAIGAPKATGGTITYDDTYYYHAFGASGTFTPQQSLTADILVVAGGGGGTSAFAGGGGAGGLLGFASQSLTATGYTVTVGAGGAGGVDNTNATPGSVGNDSRFGALTLVKGGGGAQAYESNSPASDANGGSGAGSTYRESSRSNRNPFGTATSGQGNNGGSNNYLTATYGSGGGGGAGTVGANGNTSTDRGGNGGDGSTAYSSWGLVTGTGQNVAGTVYYAGGGAGGGGSTSPANTRGGYGGGGNSVAGSSSSTRGESGLANTGGGGAGGSYGGGSGAGGGSGGSGIVIVRYLKA